MFLFIKWTHTSDALTPHTVIVVEAIRRRSLVCWFYKYGNLDQTGAAAAYYTRRPIGYSWLGLIEPIVTILLQRGFGTLFMNYAAMLISPLGVPRCRTLFCGWKTKSLKSDWNNHWSGLNVWIIKLFAETQGPRTKRHLLQINLRTSWLCTTPWVCPNLVIEDMTKKNPLT